MVHTEAENELFFFSPATVLNGSTFCLYFRLSDEAKRRKDGSVGFAFTSSFAVIFWLCLVFFRFATSFGFVINGKSKQDPGKFAETLFDSIKGNRNFHFLIQEVIQ